MKSTEAVVLPPPRLSADHLLGAPLAQLLAEFSVDVAAVEPDPGFKGGAAVRDDGSLLLVKPTGRPAAEWEMMARALLGAALRVSLPPLPWPYQLTEL